MVIEIAKDDLMPSSSRRLPPNEPDYHALTGSSIADSTARRMRWGSMKSRSYDIAERRPTLYPGQPADSYSSLDRRNISQQYPGIQPRYYDSAEAYPPSSTIRAGAYAPKYVPARGSYERSSSYDTRVLTKPEYYPPRPTLRRAEPGREEYSSDHRDARDIREGGATIRSGERYNEAQIAARYGTMPRQMPSDYARSYERPAPSYARGEQWQPDQQQPSYAPTAPPIQQQQAPQVSQSDTYAPPQQIVPSIQQQPQISQQQMPEDRYRI
jgi:hypothetical protein